MPKITKAKGATNAALYDSQSAAAGPENEPRPASTEPVEALERPAKSATRGEWDEYAAQLGVEDPGDLQNKDAVIAAVDELGG